MTKDVFTENRKNRIERMKYSNNRLLLQRSASTLPAVRVVVSLLFVLNLNFKSFIMEHINFVPSVCRRTFLVFGFKTQKPQRRTKQICFEKVQTKFLLAGIFVVELTVIIFSLSIFLSNKTVLFILYKLTIFRRKCF